MNEVVLDASAILAIIFQERGKEKLTDEIMVSAIASTVNLAEVQCKLLQKGYDPDEAWEDILSLVPAAISFSSEQAMIAGNLVKNTQNKGLALVARSCLALAIMLKTPVDPTAQAWKNLNVGVPIHVIR